MPRRRTGKLTTQQRAARRWDRMCIQNLKQLEDMRDSLLGIQTRLDKMQKLASEFNLQVNMSELEMLAQDTMKIVKEICPMPEVIVLEQFKPLSIDLLPSVACMEAPSPTTFFPISPSNYSSISLPMEAVTTPLSLSAIASIDLTSTEPQLLPPSSPTLSFSSIDTRGESITDSDDNVCIYDHETSSIHENPDDNIDLIDLNDEFVSPKTISLVVRDVGLDPGCMEIVPDPNTVNGDPEPPIPELQKQSSELMSKPPTVLKALTISKATIQLSTTASPAPAVPASQVTAIAITTAGKEQVQWCIGDSGAEEQAGILQDSRLIARANDATTSRIKTDVDESRPSEQDAKTSLSMLMSAFLSPKHYRSKWPTLNLGLL